MSGAPPRIALITGATGGIGRATSLALAKEGYSLALHYHNASETTVNDLLASVNDVYQQASATATSTSSSSSSPSSTTSTPRAEAFQADMSDLEAVKHLHARVISTLGDPAVLFANAGTDCGVSGIQSISEISIGVFEQTWRINTAAPFLLTRLCLPAMEEAGWGRVIYNSSLAGLTGGVVGGHYASSKAALHGLTHWVAGTVARKGITVNALAPALVEGTAILPSGGDELAKRIPVGRFSATDEMAETVIWMVRNAYLTNKVITVDGGMCPR